MRTSLCHHGPCADPIFHHCFHSGGHTDASLAGPDHDHSPAAGKGELLLSDGQHFSFPAHCPAYQIPGIASVHGGLKNIKGLCFQDL